MLRCLTVACVLLFSGFGNAPAARPAPQAAVTATATPSGLSTDAAPDIDQPKKEKRGSFVVAPIPVFSEFVGGGVVVVAGYVFQFNKEDEISRPSTVGLAAAITRNGTHGGIIGGQLNFGENKYQTTALFGNGKLIGEFFGIGRVPGRDAPPSVDIEARGTFFFIEGMRNWGNNIFIGPRYQFRRLSFAYHREPPPGGFIIPDRDRGIRTNTAAFGFHIQRDMRDNTFYPTKGSILDINGNYFAPAFGSDRTYQTYRAYYNGFRSIDKKQVIAYRGMVCGVDTDAPFYDLCFYGGSDDLRGYTTGQFQDRRQIAGQVEYRRVLPKRFGFVAFAGVGGTAPTFSAFSWDRLMPSAGVGLRFTLEKKHHINYRIDYGFGREGGGLSIGIGEAF